jgi:hypothetical protein
VSGLITNFVESEDGVTVVRTQDVEAILDNNKALQNHGHNGWTETRNMRHVAEIPLVVAEIWRERYGVDVFDQNHAPAVRRLLNDPEWGYLRTSGGKLRR